MSRFILVISIICLLYVLFIYLNNNQQNNVNIKKTHQITMIPSNDISTNSATIDISKNINDIFCSEELAFSENTNQLIISSYNELLTNVYKNIIMKINFNRTGTNNIINFNLKLLKDTELSNNFIQNIRNYNGSSIFKFDDSCGALFLGDYFNNNGTANYTVNHSLLEVKNNIPSFIPSNSISMVGVKQNENLYIGSQFVINFFNITDKQFINKYNLIPFGNFSTDDYNQTDDNISPNESDIYRSIKTYFKNNNDSKPRIVFMDESELIHNNYI